ncbi:MAG: AI-2E family transporter [Anaerolineae bacterium]|uniref:AI-2E family transporter n=1 Tax=Candidatus Flexifilum breve TaxID=3140694 RepID=UPI001AD0A6C6|nr:AI-2E family transporter [Chloroflexota bacterium]MBN8637984.1 AI-2E family transporter [Anaerolineae bacterium]
MHQVSPNTAYSSVTRWVLTALAVIILLVAAWIIRGILMLTLASVILVVMFTMPIRLMISHGVPRTIATIASLILVLLLVVILIGTALPTLIQQFTVLATVIVPQGVEALAVRWTNGELLAQYPFLSFLQDLDVQPFLDTVGSQFATALGQLGVQVLPVLGGVADTVLSVLIVIFLSMYLLSNPQMHQEGLIKLFPLWYRHRVREIIARLDLMLRGWLRATVISMAFVAIATGVGMALLGIQQAAALGVLAGVLSFIPNFGPIIALIPSIAVGIVQAPENLGWIIVVIYGVSFIQSQIVTPILVAGSIRLPPVLVLLGQIVAGAFLGFLGLMLAVPITAIIMILVQEVYIKDMLGDLSVNETLAAPDEALLPDGV